MKLSLIVLNYNGVHLLQEYFDSVFKQTLLPDEIIMLDNNSSDDSVAFVEKNYPKVTIIKNSRNEGTAGGSNKAFTYAKGKYIIFQSNDMRLEKNCVKGLYDAITSDNTIGICTSILLKNTPDKKGIHRIDNAGGIVDIFGFGMQKYPTKLLEEIPEQESVFFSYGGSFIISKELFKKIKGYDERFFTLNDDIDLSWRVRLLGYDIIYTKKSIIYHKVSATLGPLFERPTKRYWSERNTIATLIKNHTLPTLLVNGSIYLILLCAEMGYFMYRNRFDLFSADLKAILWNIKELPETLRRRSKIQNMKKKDISLAFERKSIKLSLFNDLKQVL
ncbi:MAG TPA: glycosyltransferase family 2 protein [Candidatus Woesebacteria bacterium]|nr:glycosyltransferase family 2 protein [Candidatus Woesebacteria bacterium]